MALAGWFPDTDEDADPKWPWQPCIQTETVLSSLQIWFETKAQCEAFIRDELIPAGDSYYDDKRDENR